MKQTFKITITTDGLDGPRDMDGIAKALEAAVPAIVCPFVCEVTPPTVEWLKPKKRRGR